MYLYLSKIGQVPTHSSRLSLSRPISWSLAIEIGTLKRCQPYLSDVGWVFFIHASFVYRVSTCDTFAVSTRVSTWQEILDITQP